MLVQVIDNLEDRVCTVTFSPDHTNELIRRGWLFTRNVAGRDVLYMNHTRLIEAVNEISI